MLYQGRAMPGRMLYQGAYQGDAWANARMQKARQRAGLESKGGRINIDIASILRKPKSNAYSDCLSKN
jgi:hypothetical protein